MSKVATLSFFTLIVFANSVFGQFPQPTDEHKVLKMEEGKWKATTKIFAGPQGELPEPAVSEGMEVNKMVGGFWVVSDFKGNFGGMDFIGHGTFGYDEKNKQHVGTWIDSFSGNATQMKGSYDKEKKTLTYMTLGVGMDGQPMKGKNVVVYDGKDSKKMTMYQTMPGADDMIKVMEIDYVRVKGDK